MPASVCAAHLPFYSHTAALAGSAVIVALCVAVLVAMAVAWWRRRGPWAANPLSAAQLDGFDHEQDRAGDEVRAQREHAQPGAG